MALQETNKNIVLVGSGALPVAGDVVATTSPVLLTPKVSTGKSNSIGTGALANSSGYVDPANVTVDFNLSMDMRSPVTLGVAPEISKLLKLAGLAETLTATTSAVYKLGGITSEGTGQVKVFNDGFSRTVTGACANLKISGKIGEPVKVEFSIKGTTTASAGVEANPVVTLNAGSEIIFSKTNSTFVVAGTALSVSDFSIDIGGKIEQSYTTGTNMFYISDCEPKLDVTFIKTKTVDENAWTQISAGGLSAITITLGAIGNQMLIDIPKAFSESVDESDDKGRVSMKRSFSMENAGVANSNFTITLK